MKMTLKRGGFDVLFVRFKSESNLNNELDSVDC